MVTYFHLLLRKLYSVFCILYPFPRRFCSVLFCVLILRNILTDCEKCRTFALSKKSNRHPCKKTARRSKIFSSAEEIETLGGGEKYPPHSPLRGRYGNIFTKQKKSPGLGSLRFSMNADAVADVNDGGRLFV